MVAETPYTKSHSVSSVLRLAHLPVQEGEDCQGRQGTLSLISQISSVCAGHTRNASTRGHCPLPCPSPMLLGELSPSHHFLIPHPHLLSAVCFCCLRVREFSSCNTHKAKGPRRGGGCDHHLISPICLLTVGRKSGPSVLLEQGALAKDTGSLYSPASLLTSSSSSVPRNVAPQWCFP